MTDKIVPEMVVATSVCPHPERWHAYDDQATEIEVLSFLRALVVMLKPQRVLETGCYHGYGTEQLAMGVRENNSGVIWTCDVDHSCVLCTCGRLASRGLHPHTLVYQCTGIELIEKVFEPIDLAFLDSGPDENRCHELRALFPKLSPGAVIAIHDTGIHGWLREKYLPPLLRELGMQHIYFDTPRGLTLCRKRPEVYP